ncbi:MAG: OprO/OprP family phosphate-selective porin [Muribaculaceae bacterium]|nr:OprO/OprP family phosphate-selective porin [Muribaculaceae bacterium]
MKRYILPIALLSMCAMPALAEPEPSAETKTVSTTTTTNADGSVTTTTVTETVTTAPEAASQSEPKFKVTPTGRILMDGAVYTSNEKELFPAGVGVPDARLGVKASYGKWSAKVDIGFGYGKVSLKDIFIQHTFNANNLLKFGYFIQQFGLQSATSSSMKISMEEPLVNEALNNPRVLGAMYVFDKGQYFATASLYAESKAMTFNSNQMRKTGYGGMSRLVWRPLMGGAQYGGNMAQVGISFQAGSPQFNGDTSNPDNHVYTISSNFPTRVAKVQAVGATVYDVNSMFKFTPELLLAHGPVALEAQYYYMQLHRKYDLPTYKAWGAYGLLRCLAIGGDYQYSHADGGIATPAPKSLEFVLGYNYINTSAKKAGIYGGRANDVSLTANWYINKYMIWRLRASYTHRWDKQGDPDINLGVLQTRFQIIF